MNTHNRIIVRIVTAFIYFGILGGLIYGFIVTDKIPIDGCVPIDGNTTRFVVSEYVPPIENVRYVNITYSFSLDNQTISRVIYAPGLYDIGVEIYKDEFSPVGKVIAGRYLEGNFSTVDIGSCFYRSSWNVWFNFALIGHIICCPLIFILFAACIEEKGGSCRKDYQHV